MSIKNDEKYFVRNVKNYMVENKISNGKMAKRMGVSTSNVTSTLNGTFDISMNFVRRVSEATGLSIPQLFSPDPKQYGSAVEDVQDGNAVAMMELMKKQMEELKEENKELSNRLVEYEKEYTALAQENLRLVSEGYNTKNTASAEIDNLVLHVNTMETGRDYMYADLGRISVEEVVGVNPLDKKVTLTLYFDEIHIK